jgi:multiple sugar transport system permease protein
MSRNAVDVRQPVGRLSFLTAFRRRRGAEFSPEGYIFILPSLVGVVAFLLAPILVVAVLSFFSWDLIGPPTFIGLQNYDRIIHSSDVGHSLLVTVLYVALNIPAQTVLALLLALFMNQKLAGVKAFRAIYVVPWMATPVVMGIVWQWVFDPGHGALNQFLAIFHIQGPAWLSSGFWAMPAVAAVNIWQFVGYNMLFFLAGLQGIPEYLYEASSLDGAGKIRTFFLVTLPLLNPTLFFVLVTSLIGSFQVFDTVYVMTAGGPGNATRVINYTLFQNAFQFYHAGYASALSMVLFGVILLVTLAQVLYFRGRTLHDIS